MSKFVFVNGAIVINSVDLSNHIQEVAVEMTADAVDTTSMGETGHSHVQGLRDDSFSMTAFSDFAAAQLDATLWPIFDGGSVFVVSVWPAGTVTSSTNPKYSGTVVLTEYSPVAGAVGDASMTSLTFPVSGRISRSTT